MKCDKCGGVIPPREKCWWKECKEPYWGDLDFPTMHEGDEESIENSIRLCSKHLHALAYFLDKNFKKEHNC